MEGLRKSGDGAPVTDQLGQMALSRRSSRVVDSEVPERSVSARSVTGKMTRGASTAARGASTVARGASTVARGVAAAASLVDDEDEGDARRPQRIADRMVSKRKSGGSREKKPAAADAAAEATPEGAGRAVGAEGAHVAAGTETAGAAAATAEVSRAKGVLRGARAAGARAGRGALTGGKLGLRSAGKALLEQARDEEAMDVGGAAQMGATAAKIPLAIARATATAVHVAQAIVGAITAVISSTPAMIAIAAATAVVIVLTGIFGWLIPTVQQASAPTASITGSVGMGDDYPYKGTGDSTMNPETGYFYGNCTDFAIWRVNRDAGVMAPPWKYTWSNTTPNGGNGAQWGLPGNMPGWETTRVPSPGDIVSISGIGVLLNDTRMPGHVAYVAAVDPSGAVTVESYGHAHYHVTMTTLTQMAAWSDSGALVIKHNPAGRIGGAELGDASGNAQSFAAAQLQDDTQFQCLFKLWTGESGWNEQAKNVQSGSYGIPQALPGEKMASAGADWKTNPITQVKWGLQYIRDRYGTPCQAWDTWSSRKPHWY